LFVSGRNGHQDHGDMTNDRVWCLATIFLKFMFMFQLSPFRG